MMIDGRAKILKLAPGSSRCHHARCFFGPFRFARFPGLPNPVFDISTAIGPVYFSQGPVSPPSIERQNPLLGFVLARVAGRDIGQIDRQNIGNQDFRGMTAANTAGPVFVGKVLAEGTLGARAIFWRAARADLARSVSDDPNCTFAERAVLISLFGAQPEAGSFSGTRHSDLMCSM
jgi:hypothetical protein